tara:strand:+ start:944 stop:1372 length:429 start_codon:yes stop_codon:yes gene_type:complete
MKRRGNEYFFRKKVSLKRKNNKKNISKFKLILIHKIFNTINISLLTLIFILSFLSLNSQRQWSITYKILSKTRATNNNLIDHISKTEEFYISELETLENLKKTTPKDLIYIDKIVEKKDNFLNKKLIQILNGLKDSRYQRGY